MADKEPKTEVGKILKGYLGSTASTATQSLLAVTTGISYSYTNNLVMGHKVANADWLNLVANTLNMNAEETEKLNRAGAIDNGFKIDITKKE